MLSTIARNEVVWIVVLTSLNLRDRAAAFLETELSQSTQNVPDPAFSELLCYTLAAIQFSILKEPREAANTIRRHLISSSEKPSPTNTSRIEQDQNQDQRRQHFQYQSGGVTPLKVATVATTARVELNYILQSAAAAGISLDVLGLGEKWNGNPTKVQFYRDYAKSMDASQLILLVDAYDVLLSPELGERVVQAWERFADKHGDSAIMFSGEFRCWPDESFVPIYAAAPGFNQTSTFKYLNSGGYMGRASVIAEMLEEVGSYPSLSVSDQRAFTRYMFKHPNSIVIDDNADIFRSLHMMHSVEGGSVTFDFDGFVAQNGNGVRNRPLVLHGNAADGQKYYRDVVKKMLGASEREVRLDFEVHDMDEMRNSVRISTDRHLNSALVDGDRLKRDFRTFLEVGEGMASRGAFGDAAKVLFCAYKVALLIEQQDGNDNFGAVTASLRTYATWFVGESCLFCTSTRLHRDGESEGLISSLQPWTSEEGTLGHFRYGLGRRFSRVDAERWTELTLYNLAVVYQWCGRSAESENVYKIILKRGGNDARKDGPSESRETSDKRRFSERLGKDAFGRTIKIAAVASEHRPELDNLLYSAHLQGTTVDVLGMNTTYSGNAQKIDLFLKYVSEEADDQLILFVDAYDVLLFDGIKKLAERFEQEEERSGGALKVIFSSETASYPDLGIARLYEVSMKGGIPQRALKIVSLDIRVRDNIFNPVLMHFPGLLLRKWKAPPTVVINRVTLSSF